MASSTEKGATPMEFKPVMQNNTGLLLGLGNIVVAEPIAQPRQIDLSFCPFRDGMRFFCKALARRKDGRDA